MGRRWGSKSLRSHVNPAPFTREPPCLRCESPRIGIAGVRQSAAMPRLAPSLRWPLAVLMAVLLLIGAGIGATRWTHSRALELSDVTARQMARTEAGLIASELQKFRLLPVVLAEYPDVAAALSTRAPAAVARLNGKLELLARRTDAAAIYVIAPDGLTLAASNARAPTSFVGQNYAFRPYFREALADGTAELFALGTISGRPGLFIARRVDGGGRPAGVIVVKVEFDSIEAGFARQPGATAVLDRHGVVLITSRGGWRFRTTRPLDAATRATVRRTLQFGQRPLPALAVDGTVADARTVTSGDAPHRVACTGTALAGAQLCYLQPLAPAEATARGTARTVVLALAMAAALAFALAWRARERRRMMIDAQRALEEQVALRTAELRDADTHYRAAREELAQANRLGSIGQITAGVAHEINQPVAAIRTFAENARRFLDRGDGDRAGRNLATIVDLTARIGSITAELRAFARRGTPAIGAVAVTEVIDGSLLLVGDRLRAAGIVLERRGDTAGLRVVADRVRLEQVLVNLLQNALEAIGTRDGGRIIVAVETDGMVRIDVADNGPGIAPDLADSLFTPFVTGKPDGLGLGLGIARDIAREFGGELNPLPSPLGGAAFRIMLRRA